MEWKFSLKFDYITGVSTKTWSQSTITTKFKSYELRSSINPIQPIIRGINAHAVPSASSINQEKKMQPIIKY